MVEDLAGVEPREAAGELEQTIAVLLEAAVDDFGKILGGFDNETAADDEAFGDQFGGGAGGSGAEIGHKVADGKVDFVSDGGDDGEGGMEDSAGDAFFVEGPEVFEAAAASREEDKVKTIVRVGAAPVVEQFDGTGDVFGGTSALHAAGGEDEFQAGMAALDDVEDVADGSAGGGSDEADAVRIAGDGAFAFGGEEAFSLEFLFEFFEGDLQGADPLHFDGVDDELVLAADVIDGEVALQDHFLAVGDEFAMGDIFAAEEDATELSAGIFEGEINVAGALLAEVGDFAGDPDGADFFFEETPDFESEFGNGKDVMDGLGRKEFAEIPLRFSGHELVEG